MDGGSWGDAMRAIDRVRERVAGLEDGRMKTAEELNGLLRRVGQLEDEAPEPTLRDQFAMAALARLADMLTSEADDVARACYAVADAMLRVREGK